MNYHYVRQVRQVHCRQAQYKKGFIAPLLLALIALLLIGGGAYVYTQQKQVNPSTATQDVTLPQATSTIPTTKQTASTAQTPDSKTANWKTYTNTQHGFEFKFPPELRGNTSGDQFMGSIAGQSVNLFVHVVSNKNAGSNTMSLASRTFNGMQAQEYSSRDNKYIYIPLSKYPGEWIEFYAELPYVDTDQILLTFKFITPTQEVSVPGMSKYIDTDFGFSFWYPSEWLVKQIPIENTFTSYPGGTVSKVLSVSPSSSVTEGAITIKEFSSPTMSITDPVLGCPMGNCTDTFRYYFDTVVHTWMLDRPDGIHSERDDTRTTVPVAPANVSNNTMGGLHMFYGGTHGTEDTIIPLSAKNFLILSRNYTTSRPYYQDPIAKTIVASDPKVATPVSATEQAKTIQAEANAYAIQQ